MKLKAELSKQGEDFPRKASIPLCPPTTSQRLKYSILSCMSSRWSLLPLVTMSLFSRSTRTHTLFNSATRQSSSTYNQHLLLTNGKGTRRGKPKSAAEPYQRVALQWPGHRISWMLTKGLGSSVTIPVLY